MQFLDQISHEWLVFMFLCFLAGTYFCSSIDLYLEKIKTKATSVASTNQTTTKKALPRMISLTPPSVNI